MQLSLKKQGKFWRIQAHIHDGRTQYLADIHFPRKRDATPFFTKLQATVVEFPSNPEEWTRQQQMAAGAIINTIPSVQELEVLQQSDVSKR